MFGSHSLRWFLIALSSIAALVAVQSANAGTYTVSACSPTSSAGSWQPVNTYPSGLTVGNMCGGPAIGPNEPQGPTDGGALFAEDSTNTTADIPNGTEAGWTFTAPTGTNIVGLNYYRSLHAHQEPDLIPGLWTGEGTTIESCPATFEDHFECNLLNNQPPVLGALDTSSLFFGVRCDLLDGAEYCVAAAPGERHAQADLYSANVTLSETTSPTISSVSGTGWNGGYASGQVPVTLSASDDSGIASVEVRSGLGAILASVTEACDYSLAVPCPNLSGVTIPLNTSATAEGSQALTLTVRDAAGNTSREISPQVIVDNLGPAPPTALTATVSGKEVILSWRNPTSPAVPITTATVALCSTACTPARTITATGLAHLPAPAPGKYTVRLSLTDAAGKTSTPASTPFTVASVGSVEKLRAIIDSHGRLYVAGPIPRGVSSVRICWHSKQGKRTLGSRCVTLHVEHGHIAVTFHPSARARRGQITVTISHTHHLLARLTATKAR